MKLKLRGLIDLLIEYILSLHSWEDFIDYAESKGCTQNEIDNLIEQ